VIEEDAHAVTRAHTRLVETGVVLGDDILIHAGLSAGEIVASVGSFKLREGVRVAVADDPERTTAN
jgi:membrane fusion protein (multidrug efflux system)